MKLKLAAPALVLAVVSTGALAQGTEGHQIGYTNNSSSEVSYSTKNASENDAQKHVQTYVAGHAKAEDYSDVEVTVFPTDIRDVVNRTFTR